MSSLEQVARSLIRIELEDWAVLHALERLIPSYESIPIDQIVKMSNLSKEEVEFRMNKLNEMGFVIRDARGYSLISSGLDAIALNALVKRDLISAIGKPIGMGKESDVIEAINDFGEKYAIKFYRIGRISFRAVRKKRRYTTTLSGHRWLIVNMQAAKKEYNALKKLYSIGVSVPEAIARERHAVLMRKIDGLMLSDIKILDSPVKVLREIIDNVKLAYTVGGIVNSDLNEYNILYNGNKAWIIDWPQYVDKNHPNSSMLLDRDLSNILRFFKKRFKVDCKLELTSFYVRGWSDKLEIFQL
ncbi:MAG: RIO1 family regulatory kinase/ATPase [Nitrososphaerales archaeon]